MKQTIDVSTGEVKAGGINTILKSSGIGSCIVVSAYDNYSKTGALAHIMLPDNAPPGYKEKNRYAYDAIAEMLAKLKKLGAEHFRLHICIAGGGNVLQKKDDTICQKNIESVTKILQDFGLTIKAQFVGGMNRRNVSLDIENGTHFCSEGDTPEKVMWSAFETKK
jgi:chemotaxis protein CheD